MEDINNTLLEEIKAEDRELYKKANDKRQWKNPTAFNLSLDRIADVEPAQSGYNIETDSIEIVVIGAGGTGGYLIRDLSRFLYSIEKRLSRSDISITVYDGDIVEEKNILRQNFLPQDIGQNKAEVIALRHTRAFGVNISYVPEMFKAGDEWTSSPWSRYNSDNKKRIFVGCVDNNAARREIAKIMYRLTDSTSRNTKDAWWIDSGNERKTGQVIVGSRNLMDVTDIYPEILSSRHDSRETLSCADRMLEDEQNMFVNQTASNLILNYLKNILLDIPMVTHGSVFNIDNKFDNYYILKRQ